MKSIKAYIRPVKLAEVLHHLGSRGMSAPGALIPLLRDTAYQR